MKRTARTAVLAELLDRLRSVGNWSGETHLQKAVFLLQEVTDAPQEYEYVLYLYGPYSKDLTEDLISMRADGLLDLESRPYPYGPSLRATESSDRLRKKFPRTLEKYDHALDEVVGVIGTRGVSSLEKLSTTLFMRTRRGITDPDSLAKAVHKVKPYIPIESAERSAAEVEELLARG